MPPTCPHGLPEGECLICQTLGTGPSAKTRTRSRTRSSDQTRPPVLSGPGEVQVVDGARAGRRHRRPLAVEVVAILIGLLVVVLVGALLFEAVRAVVHLIELAVVALGAGWVGYRAGRLRGRRD